VRAAIYGVCLLGLMVTLLGRTPSLRQARIFRAWSLSTFVAYFLNGGAFLAFYSHKDTIPWHNIGLAPIALTYVFLGIRHLATLPPARLAPAPNHFVYAAIAAHVGITCHRRIVDRGAPLSVGSPGVYWTHDDTPFVLIAKAMKKWNATPSWLFYSAYADDSGIVAWFHPFYLRWLFDDNGSTARAAPGPDQKLVVVRIGSAEDDVMRSAGAEAVEAGGFRAYLARQSAATDYSQHFIGYMPMWGFEVDEGAVAIKRGAAGEWEYLAASRIRPPPEAHAEIAYELVIEENAGLQIASYIDLPQLPDGQFPRDNDRILSSSIALLDAQRRTLAQFDYPIPPASLMPRRADRHDLVLRRTVRDLAVADIHDVELELVYWDPSHYAKPQIFRWSLTQTPANGWSHSAPNMVETRKWPLWRRVARLGARS
jgi:hypothetical protein